MTAQVIDKLIGRAADNINAAEDARARGSHAVSMENVRCAHRILGAILQAENAQDANVSTFSERYSQPNQQ